MNSLQNSSFFLFGSYIGTAVHVSHLKISLGANVGETALLETQTPTALIIHKPLQTSVPFDLTWKLIVLERQVFFMGAAGEYYSTSAAASSGFRANNGWGYNAHLSYAYRGFTQIELIATYQTRFLMVSNGRQQDNQIGFNLRLSFPGRKGLTPPIDERE